MKRMSRDFTSTVFFQGLLFLAFCGAYSGLSAQNMSNEKLGEILNSVTDSLEGEDGFWQLQYNDRLMYVITDQRYDRMRIITPIISADEVSDETMREAMVANFHSALDVRYAISEEIIWSAFIHPLRELSEKQVRDALVQVYRAAETFGTTYSSTELVFPGSNTHSGDHKKM